MKLIITCQRNLEKQTIDEVSTFLDEFGDPNSKVITKIRKKISEEPWLIRFCSRLIPIQRECESNLKTISDEIGKMTSCMNMEQSYRITIEKRDSQMKSKDIVSQIADLIPNKVSLENPDCEIVIQVMGETTGIGILPKNSILSVNREKRLGSC